MKKQKLLWLILPCFVLTLAACKPTQAPTPTVTLINPEVVLTSAAQTADVRLREAQQQTPSVTPEPQSPTPDLTQIAANQTQAAQETLLASTPAGTFTPTPTVFIPSSGSDNATFTFVETIPDGSDFAPGTTFIKSWQFRNSGSSTWSTSYALVFISGEAMSGPASVSVPLTVAPETLIDIPVTLVAPATPGTYRGYWRLRNPNGELFGDAVYVEIDVISGSGTAVSTPPTATAGATSEAPTATSAAPTITPTPGAVVSNVTISVDPTEYNGACPHTFTFTGSFTLGQASVVTYQLEAGGFPGITLPAPTTVNLDARTVTVTYELEFTASGSGWAQFHVSTPLDVTSNQVNFTLTCSP